MRCLQRGSMTHDRPSESDLSLALSLFSVGKRLIRTDSKTTTEWYCLLDVFLRRRWGCSLIIETMNIHQILSKKKKTMNIFSFSVAALLVNNNNNNNNRYRTLPPKKSSIESITTMKGGKDFLLSSFSAITYDDGKKTVAVLVGSLAGFAVFAGGTLVLLLRRISGSVGIAGPTDDMKKEEGPEKNCALFRHLPSLCNRLAWRSLGAVKKTPIHKLVLPGFQNKNLKLELLLKREDLSHPEYGGNKVRTLQHQLAVCEARRNAGEKSFQQLVSLGSGGSNQVVATLVHARKLGWNGVTKNKDGSCNHVNACWFDSDEPDLDNTLNMLSALSFPNLGFAYDWGQAGFGAIRAIYSAFAQRDMVPMMLGGNCPAGVLGQMGAVLELAEQVEAGESPDPTRIYVPMGSACTVSGLIVGTVLVRSLGLKALSSSNFKIIGCNVHHMFAKGDKFMGLHTNPAFGFMPLTITHTVVSTCRVLKDMGGPDLEQACKAFIKSSLELRFDADVVGKYGGHSEKSRKAAKHYDETGIVTNFKTGNKEKPLWICGHFVAKAFEPMLQDMEAAMVKDAPSPKYMLWMTKSAVQPRGKIDEWPRLQEANKDVKKWANDGAAESKLRPGRVSTIDGKSEDYRPLMTEIMKKEKEL